MPRARQEEPVEIEIDDLAFGGEGVGRHEGQVHFVEGALPGEKVRVLPVKGAKRWRRARLLEVLEPSPERIVPACSHASLCGGCAYQALAYPAQLDAKARQVRENLTRIGGTLPPEPEPPLASPVLWHYRNKMEFSFAPRPWDPAGPPQEEGPGAALGLHVRGRFDAVFDVERCLLAHPEASAIVERVRRFARENGLQGYHGGRASGLLRHLVVRSSRASGSHLVALVVREDDSRLEPLASLLPGTFPSIAGLLLWIHGGLATIARAERERILFGTDRIVERLGDLEFELSASSFFQTNSAAAEMLITQLRAFAPPAGTLLDLYCGVGTLGLALARGCRSLHGIDSVDAAIRDARRNAERNGIENARFETAVAEDWIHRAREIAPDLVIIDPPRAGLHPKACEGLLAVAPPWILYVSCNPSTLARDLAQLVEGGYEPERMRVLDLFPHTPHVETIVRLRRVAAS